MECALKVLSVNPVKINLVIFVEVNVGAFVHRNKVRGIFDRDYYRQIV